MARGGDAHSPVLARVPTAGAKGASQAAPHTATPALQAPASLRDTRVRSAASPEPAQAGATLTLCEEAGSRREVRPHPEAHHGAPKLCGDTVLAQQDGGQMAPGHRPPGGSVPEDDGPLLPVTLELLSKKKKFWFRETDLTT